MSRPNSRPRNRHIAGTAGAALAVVGLLATGAAGASAAPVAGTATARAAETHILGSESISAQSYLFALFGRPVEYLHSISGLSEHEVTLIRGDDRSAAFDTWIREGGKVPNASVSVQDHDGDVVRRFVFERPTVTHVENRTTDTGGGTRTVQAVTIAFTKLVVS